MAINFNLNDLQAFRAVAELSNFRKAAEALHVSQPAFSGASRSWRKRSECGCWSGPRGG